ncbi:MarR family winged helix-turn-helix transcriptional regulator [Sciscionella marina]|uniref:MarR family winged helix-turn-helix transcriptional regulator n=1 Tax=Sciscionella marina TaxID=508770 RepID=UPI00038161CD|nr:MarR family transcriptional regulator [Sciscionella marina]
MRANEKARKPRGHGNAFLLTQIGARAAQRYGQRIGGIELTPAHSGLLFAIDREPGLSQQALAAKLDTAATRLVALLDDLEQRGAIERRRNPEDRRHNALHLTEEGAGLLGEVRTVAAEHERDLTAPLTEAERVELHGLLTRIADHLGLTPGVHPGYRNYGTDCP